MSTLLNHIIIILNDDEKCIHISTNMSSFGSVFREIGEEFCEDFRTKDWMGKLPAAYYVSSYLGSSLGM